MFGYLRRVGAVSIGTQATIASIVVGHFFTRALLQMSEGFFENFKQCASLRQLFQIARATRYGIVDDKELLAQPVSRGVWFAMYDGLKMLESSSKAEFHPHIESGNKGF